MFACLLFDALVLALVELLFLPVYIGGVAFPITTAIAAVTTPLLVSEAGRLSTSRHIAAAPLLVWFVTIVVFGAFGPGGDVVLLNDWRALLLVSAGLVPSMLMLGIVMGRQGARIAQRDQQPSGTKESGLWPKS